MIWLGTKAVRFFILVYRFLQWVYIVKLGILFLNVGHHHSTDFGEWVKDDIFEKAVPEHVIQMALSFHVRLEPKSACMMRKQNMVTLSSNQSFQSNQIVLSLSQASVKRPDSVQSHREADGDRVLLFLLEEDYRLKRVPDLCYCSSATQADIFGSHFPTQPKFSFHGHETNTPA